MVTTPVNASIKVRCPGAVAHLTSCPEPSPGAWLNEATRAMAQAGVPAHTLLDFRRVARSGDLAVLLATICSWVLVD